MRWDDGVNKKAHIHAVVTNLDVRNMPLTGCVRAPGSVSLSRQTGICLTISLAETFRNNIFRSKIRTVQKQWTVP